jgi:hypothetical protein
MGVRRLFSRGGQKFSRGGQEPPLLSPADAHGAIQMIRDTVGEGLRGSVAQAYKAGGQPKCQSRDIYSKKIGYIFAI